MEEHKSARVVFNLNRSALVRTVENGPTFESPDPRHLAELLFAAGVRHGYVSMPDWREGDIAPITGDKIALNHRLNQLGRAAGKPRNGSYAFPVSGDPFAVDEVRFTKPFGLLYIF